MTFVLKTNKYKIIGKIAYIDISTPRWPRATALIDVRDISLVIDGYGRWYAAKGATTIYAFRDNRKIGDKLLTRMHRHIMGLPIGGRDVIVDHKDHDGLNNRRKNLRKTTYSGNVMNTAPRGGMVPYKGVTIQPPCKLFIARIGYNFHRYYLGHFATAEEAAHAYDVAAIKLFGEMAHLNFPKKHRAEKSDAR